MRVYIELNDLAGVQNIPFWQEKLKDFESLRNSENGTHALFQSLEYDDMVTLACIGTKIIKDWDRLSFFRLYTRCCQVWNSRHLYDIIDFRLVQSDLNINDKTIEYACKVDLEHIETLFNTRNKEGLTKLLHYSEDCDDSEYQCSYKVKAEKKIRRCLDRLSATESAAPEHTSTSTQAITENSKGAIPTESPSQKRLETIAEESQINYYEDILAMMPRLKNVTAKDSNGTTIFTRSASLYAYLAYKLRERRKNASIDWESMLKVLPTKETFNRRTLIDAVSKYTTGKKKLPTGHDIIDKAIILVQ